MITEKTEQVVYQNTPLTDDSTTKSLLYDWLQFREINSEIIDKFLVFYRRRLNLYYPKYKLMLEDEIKEIPELVNYKRETTGQLRNYGDIVDDIFNQLTGQNEDVLNDLNTHYDVHDEGKGYSDNITNGVVEHHNKRQMNSLTRTYGGSIDHDNTVDAPEEYNYVNAHGQSHGNDAQRSMLRNLPQSSEYDGNSFVAHQFGTNNAGEYNPNSPAPISNLPVSLEWRTATNQAEDETVTHSNTEDHTSTSAYTHTEATDTFRNNYVDTGSYQDDGSDKYNDLDVKTDRHLDDYKHGDVTQSGSTVHKLGSSNTGKNTRTLNDKHDSFNTSTGIYGITEAEIRKIIWDNISNSIALEWFLSKLEPAFLGVFD